MTVAELRLDGQAFTVTGASRGVGREYALLLAARGAGVVVNSVSPGAAQLVAAEIQARGGTAVAVTADVRDAAAPARIVAEAIEHFGRLDGIVANAGINERLRPFEEITAGAILDMIDVHLLGSWGLAQTAWPHFLKRAMDVSC